MSYQSIQALSEEVLLARDEQGKKVILDKLHFPIVPRESFRVEIDRTLKTLFEKERELQFDGLLKYQALEKYQGELYLARENSQDQNLTPYCGDEPEANCRVLLAALVLIRQYHQAGIVIGGISPGMIKSTPEGEVFFQDPLIMSFLGKYLETDYRFTQPAEIIQGLPWQETSDIFSWGELAYRLLTGKDPFSANSQDERIDKVLRGSVVPPKDLNPRLSLELSRLIVQCLDQTPAGRPEMAGLIERMRDLVNNNTCLVSASEANQYLEQAELNRRKHEITARYRTWSRRFGFTTLILTGITVVFFWLFAWSKPAKTITSETKPAEVVAYYFQGIETINVPLIDETVYKINNSLDSFVANIHVINATQQGTTFSSKDNIKLKVDGLKVQKLSETSAAASFKVAYTLQIQMPAVTQFLQREEVIHLKPVKKVWRINKIKILKEKRWETPVSKEPATKTE